MTRHTRLRRLFPDREIDLRVNHSKRRSAVEFLEARTILTDLLTGFAESIVAADVNSGARQHDI
jgi:hypothetical protein